MAKKKTTSNNQGKNIPLKFTIPENIITRFATNITVQKIQNDFKISFYEQNMPICFDKTIPKEIEAICISSIIVTADRLPAFVEVLQNSITSIQQAQK